VRWLVKCGMRSKSWLVLPRVDASDAEIDHSFQLCGKLDALIGPFRCVD
jgi:hypothetical protein